MQCKKETRIFSHKLVKLTLEIPRYIFGSMDTMESIDIDCIYLIQIRSSVKSNFYEVLLAPTVLGYFECLSSLYKIISIYITDYKCIGSSSNSIRNVTCIE